MALNNGNVGFNELVGGLSALKRRARLTGQQVTEQDIKNMSDPIYAAYRAYKPNQMALEEQKRQEMMENKQQLDQAEEAKSAGQMKTGIDALGTGLTAYKTMGGKTPTLAQAGDFVSKGITKGAELGKTLINGSPTELLNTTPTLANAGTISSSVTGTPATIGAAMDPGLAAAMEGGVGDALGTSAAELAGTAAPASGIGTLISQAAGPAAIVAGADAVKKMFGGQDIGWGGTNNDWNDKSVVEQMTSAPGTAGAVVPFAPGMALNPDDPILKIFADAERMALKPISWLLGGK